MDFEYDPAKSASNLDKHGIDFETAQALWGDPAMIEAPALTSDEERYLSVGRIKDRIWTAIWTPRKGRIRIISVRRARKEEIRVYEST